MSEPKVLPLTVDNLPNISYAYSNMVYLHVDDFNYLHPSLEHDGNVPRYVQIGSTYYISQSLPDIPKGTIRMGPTQRRSIPILLGETVRVQPFYPSAANALGMIRIQVDIFKKGGATNAVEMDAKQLRDEFKTKYKGHVFFLEQLVIMNFEMGGLKLDMTIDSLEYTTMDMTTPTPSSLVEKVGQLLPMSTIEVVKAPGSRIKWIGDTGTSSSSSFTPSLFRKEFDFEKLGIGGLQTEFHSIFRRAFASRMYPTSLVQQMGLNHVRGMLLFGPPGCGKTLIARQIGKVLEAREPKIVNGPEILDKYVGGTEENIRALFADAEKEQDEVGEESMLHIIIFDEIDAICKKRGSTRDNTGVHDSLVNQLLSKIDGVDSLNNILIIGMTNRKDLIDEALLRPGRLEVHVEIGLPDEKGRFQILNIHTKAMRESKRLTEEAIEHLPSLANRTNNYTGAELEGLVRSASSFSFSRHVDLQQKGKTIHTENMKVEWTDFEKALEEVQPALGVDTTELDTLMRNGILRYGPTYDNMETMLQRLVEQVRRSEKTSLLTVLLEGPPFSGKTTLAAHIAKQSNFPFVKLLSADSMMGGGEVSKSQDVYKAFMDAYRSPLSLIFIDDIERIIEYTPVGPRFSNMILQTLLVLLKKQVPHEKRKLMIIATTSIADKLDDLQLLSCFNVKLTIPPLTKPAEFASVLNDTLGDVVSSEELQTISHQIPPAIGIKQFLMVTEMCRQHETSIDSETFLTYLRNVTG